MSWQFLVSAAALLLVALASVLWPLLRRPARPLIAPGRSNLEVLRDALAELESDRRMGLIDRDQYDRARTDLERRVLEETDVATSPQESGHRRIVVAGAVGLGMPLAAALLYLALGAHEAIETSSSAAVSPVTPEQFQSMTEQLAARLKEQPDDWEGWVMLGRAYKALERYEDSARAWGEAARLRPQDANTLTDYAEALAIVKGGKLSGEPTRILERALQLDPRHQKALALAGGAAFTRGDYKAAIAYWEHLLAISDAEPELGPALRSAIAQARSRMGGAVAGSKVSGTVSLAPELAARAGPDDTVFVFARSADGARAPLAVLRLQVKNLPYDFTLDDTMAMTPGANLSSASRVVVGARVSKSGEAQTSSGDLEGYSAEIRPGARGVRVVIDREVE